MSNGDIERFAGFDLFDHHWRRRVLNGQLVAGRALELRNDFLECPGEGSNRQHFDLSRLRAAPGASRSTEPTMTAALIRESIVPSLYDGYYTFPNTFPPSTCEAREFLEELESRN